MLGVSLIYNTNKATGDLLAAVRFYVDTGSHRTRVRDAAALGRGSVPLASRGS